MREVILRRGSRGPLARADIRHDHGDMTCECGAGYNCFGQRLRDDWRGNPSNYNDEIGDMEGFEIQQLRDHGEL
jgi:hypothetical protein